MKHPLPIALLCLTVPLMAGASDKAHELSPYFASCNEAGRALWNHSLCAPVVVVDPESGGFTASQASPGPLPPIRANTAFDWMGTTWLMVLRPLPADSAERASLLFHESFHVHQRALGFAPNSHVARHLSSWQARVSIRLEWAELRKALASDGTARERHVRRALGFRARRLVGNPAAANAERALMRHEGLASYTGVALSGDPVRLALRELDIGPERPSLGRSFAYSSAPAWGLLLDRMHPGWKTMLEGGQDLPDLFPLRPLASRVVTEEEERIAAEEQAREASESERLHSALSQTAVGSAFRLPLSRMSFDFDPNRASAAPDHSQLYWKITLRDAWGSVATDGTPVRVLEDLSAALIPWPLPADVELTIDPGWKLQATNGAPELVRDAVAP